MPSTEFIVRVITLQEIVHQVRKGYLHLVVLFLHEHLSQCTLYLLMNLRTVPHRAIQVRQDVFVLLDLVEQVGRHPL